MISTLTGILREKNPPFLLLDVNQVGYELQAPMTTFYQLPELNNTVTMFTHLSIREDAHQLYGFSNNNDRNLFRALIKINGVGPKLALSILSGLEPQQFIAAIHAQDLSGLLKIPGIGKKTAERLMIECRDTVLKLHPTLTQNTTTIPAHYEDSLAALSALGYKPQEAKKAIDHIYHAELKTEDLIRKALTHLVK